MGDVALDFQALVLIEAAPAHRELLHLRGRQQVARMPIDVMVRTLGDFQQLQEASLLQHRGLVGGENRPPGVIDDFQLVPQVALEDAHGLEVLLAPMLQEEVQLPAGELGFQRLLDEVEARLDQLLAVRIELLGLDQNLLAHADLPQIVKQARIAQLPNLLPAEVKLPEVPHVEAIDLLGECHGQAGDPRRVARGGRVSRLDGGDRGVHEALEEALDTLVEDVVLDRDRRLAG
ncbi:hypothetical protein D3C87_1004480 [compost metagenome]